MNSHISVSDIKELLRRKNVSCRSIAKATGMSKSNVHRVISQGFRWTPDDPKTKKRLAAYLRKTGVLAKGESLAVFTSASLAEPVETAGKAKVSTAKLTLVNEDKILRRHAMLTQEIIDRINCERDPFTDEIGELGDVLPTPQHKYVLSKMLNAAVANKFIGVWGRVGSGKSIIKQVMKEQLQEQKNYIISEPFITDRSRCKPGTIQDAMITDFMSPGWGRSFQKLKSTKSLEEKSRLVYSILRNKAQDGKKCVLVIDEAHDLPLDTIKALKRFHEYQDGFKKLMSIILIGQEELFEKLQNDYRVREVSARIDLIELRPIVNLVEEYIAHKINRAGGSCKEIIDNSAFMTIKRLLPRANPLMINNLISNAIISAWKADQFPVNGEMVEMVYKDIASL